MILVTGGAGFIGANFVIDWLRQTMEPVLNLDKLTYAGNYGTLRMLDADDRHIFIRGDIADRTLLDGLLQKFLPRAIVHFAAESHVDRSIAGPHTFIETNLVGTSVLLEASRAYWESMDAFARDAFRFVHISTDEVFGSLEARELPFPETSAYAPSSPYSASKAGSDHLVRAWHRTYGLPVLITHCSNNYGPYQFPEKLIPLTIQKALAGEELPIYGDGCNVRDWLYVLDHCEAIRLVLERGRPGQAYNIGGGNEKTNLDVVRQICSLLDEARPLRGASYRRQIAFVQDRPGHDRRYAIDAGKLRGELGWSPRESFESGLARTVQWYLGNEAWAVGIRSGAYRRWLDARQGEGRLQEVFP